MEATFVPPRSAISYLWPHNWHTSSTTRCLPALPSPAYVSPWAASSNGSFCKHTHTHSHTLGTISLFCALLAEFFVCRFSIFSLSFFIILLPFAKWRQMSELLKAVMVNKNIRQGQRAGRGGTAAVVRLTQSETEFLQRPTKHITLKVTALRVERRGSNRFPAIPFIVWYLCVFFCLFAFFGYPFWCPFALCARA